MSETIIIVGGSLAGMSTGIFLKRLGYATVILEQSSGIAKQGSGITLPEVLVNRCIELDLFDKEIPRLHATSRAFMRKEDDYVPETFFVQPIQALTLNWLHVYENLRKRLDEDTYLANECVKDIQKYDEKFYVKTLNKTYTGDYVIAADGVDSTVNKLLFPASQPQYAGYVAWRGVIPYDNAFNLYKKVDYGVFSGGHLLMYQIPAQDDHTQRSLNWVLYEDRQDKPLSALLTDKYGLPHTRSLPKGLLSKVHISELHELAERVLAPNHAQIIKNTSEPFIQAIFDLPAPAINHCSVLTIGDAGGTLRPHLGSGTGKALKGAIDLFERLHAHPDMPFREVAAHWQKAQNTLVKEESKKSIAIGEAMVTKSPDWREFNQQSTERWWDSVLQGKSWYITTPPKYSFYQSRQESANEAQLVPKL